MTTLSAEPADAAGALRSPLSRPAEPAAAFIRRGTGEYWRTALALFLAGYSTFSLIYAVQPLMPNFAAEFHITPAESSLALSVTTGALAFAILCAGAVSESFGRKGLMFASMAVAALLHLFCAGTQNWHLLLTLRALEGLALGGVPAVAMAYLAEEIDPRDLGFAMGVYVGGTALGAMLGRVGVGYLAEMSNWRVAVGTLGGLDLLSACGFALLLPGSRHFTRRRALGFGYHRDAWLRHLRHPRLVMLFAAGFLALGVFVATFNYLTFRLTEPPYGLDQSEISAIFFLYLFGVASSSIAGSFVDRLGRGVVLVIGVLAMIAGVLLTLLAPLPAVIAGVIGVTIGFFIAHSVASGWVGRLADGAKGHASSLYLLFYYVGSSVAGSAAGLFWSLGGWPAVAGFVGALLAAFLMVALKLLADERRAA